MTPALTKICTDGHGIHLSSCPTTVRLDSAGGTMCSPELKMKLTDDGDLQKKWPLPSSYFPQSSCLTARSMDVSDNAVFSPSRHASASQHQTVLLPSASSVPSLCSVSEGLTGSQQVASVFPGGADMFSAQEACLLQGHSPDPRCGPDGGDVHPSLLPIAPPLYSQADIVSRMGGIRSPPSSRQLCGGRLISDQLTSKVMLKDAVRERLSRQVGLQSQAQKVQRRLQVLLGEHAVQHCSQQLEGLKRQLGGLSVDSQDSKHHSTLPLQVPFSSLGSSVDMASFTECREFSHLSQAVLRGLQAALDSEATASSSSDEEQEEIHSNSRTSHVSSSWKRRWLKERAEVGSRWSWLQIRVAELELRIQQMVELYKHIRSNRGKVVLADFQPPTDTQIKPTVLREMAGLSCTAMDTDNEPCSPTRLLYNIERQSAQLSQFVNSVMPPLSLSPVKQTYSCKDEKATSGQRKNWNFWSGSSNRKRPMSKRIYKVDMSCVCARTRPLVTYHKPRLFTLSSHSPSSSYCSDPDSTWTLSSRTPSCLAHSVSCLSFDPARSQLAREEWHQIPLSIDVQPNSPVHHNRCSSTPLYKSRKLRKHPTSPVMDLSPIEITSSATESQHTRAFQRKLKRRHVHRPADGIMDVLYRLCDTEGSSDEMLEQRYTQGPRKQASRGFVGKRQGESMYNINNIVIPMLAKVEKLQYKDIMTPNWRVTGTAHHSLVMNPEAQNEEGQEEDLSDEVFAQRHLGPEQREKLRWASWGKRKCHRRLKRCCNRSSSSRGGICTSGEERFVDWSCALPDTDEQLSPEECLPQTSWERRMFPLDEDDEKALLFDNTHNVQSLWAECGSSSTPNKSNSHLAPTEFISTTPPSGGQNKSS